MPQTIDYPTIIKKEIRQNQLELEIIIPPELSYFNGHYPEQPIVAGVVQINWVVEYAQKYLQLPKSFKSIKSIKFQKLMEPQLQLSLKVVYTERKLSFTYQKDNAIYSSGILLY